MKPNKPLVTFFLFAYNQEQFIAEAVNSALAQDYENLEIILSDDASRDRTYSIMEDLASRYMGPHSVRLLRNEKNLGLINHVNKAMRLFSGDLLVLAAGDDISHSNRTTKLVEEYLDNGKPLLLHSKATAIDLTGHATGEEEPAPALRKQLSVSEAAVARGIYLGASGVWARLLIEKYGPIMHLDAHEDAVMGFRALLENSIHYIDKPLLSYRIGNGMSHAKIKVGEEARTSRIKDLVTQLNILQQRLHDMQLISNKNEIKKLLYNKINKINIKLHFYTDKKVIFRDLLKRPLVTISSLFNEIRLELTRFRKF